MDGCSQQNQLTPSSTSEITEGVSFCEERFYEDPQTIQSFQNSIYPEVDASYGAYQQYDYGTGNNMISPEHMQYQGQNWNSMATPSQQIYQERIFSQTCRFFC